MSKLAFVFPGQGSQEVGMLADAGEAVREKFLEASDVLGYDLWQLVSQGPADQLDQTEYTQPALLTASVSLYEVAMAEGVEAPAIVAGHSLGEYSALVVAGVLKFADAVSLVQQRGRFMQTAVPIGKGGMAAILGLDDEQVRAVCAAASQGEVVQAVNYNAPGQVVIAGASSALQRAIDGCKEAGAKRALPLSVSAPFHSELMKPAAEAMASALAAVSFSPPSTMVIQNVDARVQDDPDTIRQNLVTQMYSAVLWTDTVSRMVSLGVSRMVECGPGKVLSGLAKRIDRSVTCHNIDGLAAAREAALSS